MAKQKPKVPSNPKPPRNTTRVTASPRVEPAAAVLAELNERHAVVREAGRTVVITEETDPVLERRLITRSTFPDFKHFYQNRQVAVRGPGNTPTSKPVGDFWLQHPQRRQYQGIVFSPGKDVPGYLNLWTGFTVEPVPGDWSLMRAHLREVICAGNDEHDSWLLHWLARAIQHPAERAEVALALRGRQGAGKGSAAQYVGGLFGPHFIHLSSGEHLTGRFNAHLEDAVVIFADEAFGTDDRHALAVLKMLITEPIVPIERKGHDVRTVRNFAHLILASNESWAVPAALDERRFFVLDVSDHRRGDGAYFQALAHEMEHGGRAAMLHDLLHLDLSTFDFRNAPVTDALRDQQVLSMKPEEQWWLQKLVDGRLLPTHTRWEREVQCDDLHADYVEVLKRSGVTRRSTQTELGMFMKRVIPRGRLGHKQRQVVPPGPFNTPSRPYFWQLPPLDVCRAHFDSLMRSPLDWPKVRRFRRSRSTVTTFSQPRPGRSSAKRAGNTGGSQPTQPP